MVVKLIFVTCWLGVTKTDDYGAPLFAALNFVLWPSCAEGFGMKPMATISRVSLWASSGAYGLVEVVHPANPDHLYRQTDGRPSRLQASSLPAREDR